jgi:ADP-heptose:LPS heptosyltransferase
VHNLKVALRAEVDWVVQPEYAALVRCFTDVRRVIVFPRRSFAKGVLPFLRALRAERYDRIVDLQGLLKSALVARLARGGARIGPSFHREAAHVFYTAVAGPRDKSRHAVEENLDIVRHLGLERLPPVFPLAIPPAAPSAPRPRIGLLPASRWPTKNWPPECFAALGRLLRGRVANASFFLLGGRADVPICNEIQKAIGGDVFNRAGQTSLVEMGGLLRELDLLVTNDSGPMHMAAALGTPTLAIFGPTDPGRTGPYGDGHAVVSVALPCRPCFSRTCRVGGVPCLQGVTPERVADTALRLLERRAP